jgi:hypothetical protein
MGARAEISEGLLRQLMINDTKVWAALKAAGDDAVEFWKSVAPSDEDDKEHKLMAHKSFMVRPGDYERAIRARFLDGKEGKFIRVQDFDPKANWLEFGSVHNPNPTAPCAQTRAYMQSRGFRA